MTKKEIRLTLIWAVGLLALAIYGSNKHLSADTGWEGATRREVGSYIDVRRVVGSSVAGTAFFAASTLRPDGSCVNNSANTVWVGTVSAAQHGVPHSNILEGYPVTSTQPFKLDGSMTGVLYFTCDAGIAACQFRCVDGLVR